MLTSNLKIIFKRILSEKAYSSFSVFVNTSYTIYCKILLFLISHKYLPKFINKYFRFLGLELRKFENIEYCTISEPRKAIFVTINVTSLYYSPPIFDFSEINNFHLIENQEHKTYIAILRQVKVIGASNLILLTKDKALYDLKYDDPENKYKYTDGAIVSYNSDSCLVASKDSHKSYNEAILLAGNFTFNYYHFVFETLIKFEQIDRLNINVDVPILIDSICLKIPQFVELLNILNSKKRMIIGIEKRQRYFVDRLFYISCPNFIPPDFLNIKAIKPEDILLNLTEIENLRLKLLSCSFENTFPKRIFISRSNTSGRRQYNEKEVFEVLKNYHFTSVFPEKHSISEQITMFNNAEIIVGGSGAAFTNLLFCKQGCKVIILTKNNLPFSGFSTIAKYIGIDLIYLAEELNLENMRNIHDPFIINKEKLNTICSNWFGKMN